MGDFGGGWWWWWGVGVGGMEEKGRDRKSETEAERKIAPGDG